MSQKVIGTKAFTATAAIEAHRLVKLTAASGTHVEKTGAGDAPIGVCPADVALGGIAPVDLRSNTRTYKCVASKAIAAGSAIYAAADGKVSDAVVGSQLGTALEASTNDLDVIEVLLDNGTGSTVIDFGATGIKADAIEESTGGAGTLIGSTSAKKVGFHGTAATAQRASANQTALTDNTGGSVADAVLPVNTLTDNGGGAAADRTIGAIAANAITATSPGSGADGTTPAGAQWTAAVTDLGNLRTDVIACRDAVKELSTASNIHNDNIAKIAELLNEIRLVLVNKGLMKGSA